MAKRPLRKLNNSLSRPSQRKRTGNNPLLIYFGVTLTVIICLYAKLLLNSHHHIIQKNDIHDTNKDPIGASSNSGRPGSNSIQQQLQQKKQQQQQRRDKLTSDKVVGNNNEAGGGGEATTLLIYRSAQCKGDPINTVVAAAQSTEFQPTEFPKSVLVRGKGLAETYAGKPFNYKGTVMEPEGCVDFYNLFKDDVKQIKFIVYGATTTIVANQQKVLTAQRQIDPDLQKQFATVTDLTKPHTRFIFSATSSKYFGYQVLANALGFLDSKQTDSSWTRLLSAGQFDDLREKFPTFTAPKSLYERFYQPINKPDIIDKWFHSPDAPNPDDTIVVIDPDNWLINDLHGWAKRVSSKNALAQAAYYSGNKMLQDLWQDICKHNCHIPTDPAAVPYLLKASDLRDVAPLWRSYSIDIKERFKDNTTFKEKYGPGLGVRWAAEMFGYNAACTHLNIKTTIVSDMQLRDVDGGKRQWDRLRHTMPMIHMGRAWFPKEKPELAAPWRHSKNNEPGSIAASGIEVWCKCNGTAPFAQPWPLPDNLDFVSYHTLRLLHDSVEKFGPVPVNENFRKEKLNFYTWSVP